jgi:hypothetical protein
VFIDASIFFMAILFIIPNNTAKQMIFNAVNTRFDETSLHSGQLLR